LLNGTVVSKQRFPSPSPHVLLHVVEYMVDGLRVKGLLAEPVANGRYDGFLYLRGGIKSVGMVRVGRIVQFASEGFVVMAPFYRGNQGGEGNEDFAGEDRYDALSALGVLEQHSKVDKDNIHVFGFSRGGVMALFVAELSDTVRSLVLWGGVTDMVLTYNERKDLRRMMKRVIGGSPNKVPEAYKWRTPLYEVNQISCPVLLIHGVHDENVSVQHAYKLEEELKKLNHTYEAWYFEGFTHYFPPRENRRIVHSLTSWMKKHSSLSQT
jgi:dipeptidyl aminopeptidase/acylaminoacyl peptidase